MREQAFCFHVCSTHLLMSRLSSGLGPSQQMCSFKNRNLPCFPQGAWGVGHVCPVWRGNEDLSSEVSRVSIWDCVVSLCLCGAGLLGVWLTCLIYCDAFETHTHTRPSEPSHHPLLLWMKSLEANCEQTAQSQSTLTC